MTVRKHNGKTVFGLYTKYSLEDNVIDDLNELCKMVDKRDEIINNSNAELLKRGCRISELQQKCEQFEYNYSLSRLDAINQRSVLEKEIRISNEHFDIAKKELEGANDACIKVCARRDALATEVGDIRREKHALDNGLVKARAEFDALKKSLDKTCLEVHAANKEYADEHARITLMIEAREGELECLKAAKDKTDAENTRLWALDKNEMHRKYEGIRRYSEKQNKQINELKDALGDRMYTVNFTTATNVGGTK